MSGFAAALPRCWEGAISKGEGGSGEQAAIDLFVVVEYGVRIPDVAWKIQENVKRAIEGMTGLEVVEVNVHVQGVNFPQQEERVEEQPRVR